jgi:hypothetical protein
LTYVLKLRSRPLGSAVHDVPLVVDVTRWPFAYGFEFGEQLHVYA